MNAPERRDTPAPRTVAGPPATRALGAITPREDQAAPLAGGMPNALELLQSLRYRWRIAAGLGLLCAGLAVAATWWILPAAEYSTQALLHVAERQPRIIFDVAGDKDRANFSVYQQTQLTLLKSRMVLNAALRDPAVAALELDKRLPDPIAWLEKNIHANYRGEVLQIAMDGPEPDELAVVVNAVTDAYIEEVVNVEANQRRVGYETLQGLSQTYQDRLQEKKKQLKSQTEQLGANSETSVQFTQELAIERREMAKNELLQLEKELKRLQVTLALRRESPNRPAPTASAASGSVLEQQFLNDPILREYRDQYTEWSDRLRSYRKISRSASDPGIRQAEQALARLELARAARMETLRADLQQPGGAAGLDDTIALEQQIHLTEELAALAQSQVENLSRDSRDINHETWLLEELQSEIGQIDAAANKIGGELEALSVELDAPQRVTPYERAEQPRLQADKRPKLAAVAGAGTFGLVLFGVSMIEYRTRRVRSVDEVIRGLQLQLVGALPALPGRSWRPGGPTAKREAHWRSLLLESIDAMRALLLRAAATESVRTVMISSAVASEGKTSLASHLATSLARAGRRTLLVDCDLRKPDVHRLFDLVEGPGLSELLRGEADFDGAIQPSPVTDLWVLTAGHPDGRAIQALAYDSAGLLFGRLAEQFDFVIIDTAPVLLVADALLIGQYVDGAICSVMRDVSRVPKVQAANQRLKSVGIRVLGAVMTGIQGESYGTDYSYSVPAGGSTAARTAG